MKALSIGRDQTCDIVINDNTDVISRRHAVLNISSSGKITLIDQSRNGTYVNGIRISPNVPVPVSRKDIISFAHVAKLDWNAVPASPVGMRYVLIGAATVLIMVCGVLGYKYIPGNHGGTDNGEVIVTDTVRDLKPVVKDTLDAGKDTANVKRDKKVGKDTVPAPLAKPKKKPAPKPEPKPEPVPKDTVNDNRPIG